jgi:hypothetical protein
VRRLEQLDRRLLLPHVLAMTCSIRPRRIIIR